MGVYSLNIESYDLNLLTKVSNERDQVRRLYFLRILANTEFPAHLVVALVKGLISGHRSDDQIQQNSRKNQPEQQTVPK